MKTSHTCNSIAGVEAFLATLHPEKEIAVVKDNSYYYVVEPGPLLYKGDTLEFEGMAKDFNNQ